MRESKLDYVGESEVLSCLLTYLHRRLSYYIGNGHGEGGKWGWRIESGTAYLEGTGAMDLGVTRAAILIKI